MKRFEALSARAVRGKSRVADAKVSSLEEMVKGLRADLKASKKSEKELGQRNKALEEEKVEREQRNRDLQSQLDVAKSKGDEVEVLKVQLSTLQTAKSESESDLKVENSSPLFPIFQMNVLSRSVILWILYINNSHRSSS